MNPGTYAALAPLVAFLGAVVTPVLGLVTKGSKRVVFTFMIAVLAVIEFATLKVAYYVLKTGDIVIYKFAAWPPPLGIVYEVDALGALMGALAATVLLIAAIYSYGYFKGKGFEWFATLYLGLAAGLIGVAYTGDVFNLFVMAEVMSIAAYGLVAYLRERGYPLVASLYYAFISSVGLTLYFIAVVILYTAYSSLTMGDIAAKMDNAYLVGAVSMVSAATLFAALSLWSFAIKAAIFPNHFWLPGAYSAAPTPAVAVMAGVEDAMGMYVIIRLFYSVIPPSAEVRNTLLTLLFVLGIVNAVIGAAAMLVQKSLRKIIAYSIIMDMGFVAMGVGLGTKAGLTAAISYMMYHAFVKPPLFMAAGMLEDVAGSDELNALAGVGKLAPFPAAAFALAALAVVGIPPLNMFYPKIMLYTALIEKGYAAIAILVIVVSSALALAAFVKVFYTIFMTEPKSKVTTEKSISKTIALTIAIAAMLASALLYFLLQEKVVDPAATAAVDRDSYIQAILRELWKGS